MEKYIDEYFILVFSITDENHSWYIDDNILMYTEAGQVDADDPDFEESNIMRCKIMKNFSSLTSYSSNFYDFLLWFPFISVCFDEFLLPSSSFWVWRVMFHGVAKSQTLNMPFLL